MKKYLDVVVQLVTEAGVVGGESGRIRATVGNLTVYSRSAPTHDSVDHALEAILDELRRLSTQARVKP